MRKRLPALFVAVGAALLAASAGMGAGGLQTTRLASVNFPDRAFVLAVPKPIALKGAQVHVTENGRPVLGVSVVPAKATLSRTFGVVLVIDASNSMRGVPIAEAMKAARVFVAHKAPSAALGVVTFNRTASVVVPPTADTNTVLASLSTLPALARGTHLYDATSRALDVLKAEKIKAGSIVLLSDGHDTGSLTSSDAVAAKARAAGVRVFAVGLRSPQYSPGPLRSLSRATGAAYAESSATGLPGIYKARSEQLANEYLLRYRSLAGPAATVNVKISVAGLSGQAATSYQTPALPSTSPPPFHRGFFDRFLASSGSVVLMSLLAAGLAWFGISTLLRSRRSGLQGRISEYSTEPSALGGTEESLRTRERLLSHVLLTAERAFERTPWWDRFKEELDIAEYRIGPVPLAAGTVALTIVAAIVLGLISPFLALFALAVPLFVRSSYKQKLARRRKAFEAQMPDNLTVLAASLRAGHSFVGALSSVLEEAEEPSRSELRRAIADEQLGVPIEDALLRVARRMDSADLEQVALVASLQRETGGNTAEVLDAVVDSVRERFQLRRLVATLTAQGRLARWILIALPIVTGLVIALLNPGYLRPLFTTATGQFLLVFAAVLLVIGSFAIKRITEIEI